MRRALPPALLCAMLSALPARAEDARSVIFAGVETGPSPYLHAGFKHSLSGSLDQQGFLAMAIAGVGDRRDESRHALATAMVGYQWTLPRWHAALFAGPEMQRDGPTRLGARIQGEVWARPFDDTLLTLTAIAGSARPGAWARVSGGYRLWDDVHVGPEASYKHEGDWRETRAGLHVTGLAFGGVTWRLSGGRAFGGSGRDGYYAGLSGHVRLGGD